MKRLIVILIFLFSGIISAQNFSTKDVTNSTDTALDSAGVFSPNEWRLVTNYNSITVTIKSNRSSASSGVKIKFATRKTNGTYVVVDSINATYTAGTIFNNAYPITAPYLKVYYTNTTAAQSYFSMVTMLNVSFGATAISIAGGATATNQSTLLNYQHPSAINWAADSISATTSVDSIAFSGAAVKWKLRVFAIDGTVIFSTDKTFVTNKRIAYAWTEITPYDNMSAVTYPKIYYKSFVGTVKINYAGEGY